MTFLLAVTVTSMLLAAIMSVIAWRIAVSERRRSEARVAALAAEIHDAAPPRAALQPEPSWARDLELRPGAPLFAARAAAQGARPLAIIGGGALVLVALLSIGVVASGWGSRTAADAGPAQAGPARHAPLPLELVALGHERVGDQLTVRGVIRNPPSGAGVDGLTAVVFLFGADGGFIDSGRAPVDASALHPGGEGAFSVTMPRAAAAGRYRVSFRTDDRLVPHVDRRHEQG